MEVETEVPQRSPVSPIVFVIYLSWIFKQVEEEVEGFIATLFADDYRWLVTADSVAQLYDRLERQRVKAAESEKYSHVHSTMRWIGSSPSQEGEIRS